MECIMTVSARAAFTAACHREVEANLVNRFLHAHLALAAAAGLLPLFTPDAVAAAAPLWVLHAVLYCLSLSAMLLGLSSAHADADEFPLLFSQPAPRWAWLGGKVAALTMVLVTASMLLVLPALWTTGATTDLVGLTLAAGGVALAMTTVGLGVGFWVRDPVRGLLTSLGVWFTLLFGTDLLLLAVSGAPWVQERASLWVALLMVNPLDALRITVLFQVEQAAFAGIDAGRLAQWWIQHAWAWQIGIVLAWTAFGFGAGLLGARRRVDA
jgi:hypothetical protein